jgi:AraC family transcriptional regulator, arabinose operon regulatory protein
MNDFLFTNSLYALHESIEQSCTGFNHIWKVVADNRYCASHPYGMAYHGLFITIKGEGNIDFPQTKEIKTIEKNSIFLLPKHTVCKYRCGESGYWNFYFIGFSSDTLIQELSVIPNNAFQIRECKLMQNYCDRLISILIGQRAGYRREADLIFQQILLSCARNEKTDTPEIKVEQAIQWIHGHIKTTIHIEDLLAVTNLSRSVFFRIFRAQTGKPPYQYIMELKIENACHLLMQTSLQIKHIASLLGFYDESSFSHQFKASTGISPSNYRDKAKIGI